jgi:hypothetical protein
VTKENLGSRSKISAMADRTSGLLLAKATVMDLLGLCIHWPFCHKPTRFGGNNFGIQPYSA